MTAMQIAKITPSRALTTAGYNTPIFVLPRVDPQARVLAAKIQEILNFAASVLIPQRLSYVNHMPATRV
jgi:hypothetical protein